MAVQSLKHIIEDSYQGGQHWYQPFRKVVTSTTAAGFAYDLSMGTGNPRPNFYVGDQRESKVLNGNLGVWSGGSVSPASKYLHTWQVYSPTLAFINAGFILCDYCLFYPLIDGDELATQLLVSDNELTRYTDGAGLKAMLVATNPYVGNVSFYITYTNHNGVSNRQSKIMQINTAGVISAIATQFVSTSTFGGGLFIELQEPSDGIRTIDSITLLAGAGGLFALVLVKPLAQIYGREILSPAEWDMIKDCGGRLPEIYDGAYLNMLCMPNGNLSGAYVQGDFTFIWD